MFEERKPSDTSKLAMLLFRIGIVAVFFIMVGRMVQLQVMRPGRVSHLGRHQPIGAARNGAAARRHL
jgi:hypothetical protein